MRIRRMGLLIAVGALIATFIAVAAPAQAAHRLGTGVGERTICVLTPRGHREAIVASLWALGSDVPRNSIIAATASIGIDLGSLHHCDDPPQLVAKVVTRIQIDRLELDYVGPGIHHSYSSVGPVNFSGRAVAAYAPGRASIQCNSPLAIRMYYSVRYNDDSVARYSMSTGAFYRCRS